jgi:hypothetical protein
VQKKVAETEAKIEEARAAKAASLEDPNMQLEDLNRQINEAKTGLVTAKVRNA